MSVRVALAGVLAVVFAGPGIAQDQISPEAFLDEATGRTLTFTDVTSGNVIGVEQFLRRDQTVWATKTGRCTYGRIELRGPYICFIYEDFPEPDNCWMPFQHDGTLLVMSTRSRQIQRVTTISSKPLACENTPMS